MSKLLSDEELRAMVLTEFKQVHRLAPADYTENCTNVVMGIFDTQKRLYAESEKLGLIDKLNKNMFYSDANPSGQHIKNCLMAEHDALQPMPPSQIEQIEYGKFRRAERRGRIK